MPLLKKAQTPTAPAPSAEAQTATPTASPVTPPPSDRAARLARLEAKDRKILLQGSYQNALQSMGAVQHGGKTPADYLARVEEFANATVDYVLKNV